MKVIEAITDEAKRTCFRMRHKVMCEELGWISPKSDIPEESDEYDWEQSIHMLVLDDYREPVGSCRLILEGDLKLPIEVEFKIQSRAEMENEFGEISSCAEGSRFIVPSNGPYKHHEVSMAMCNATIMKCHELGISHLFVSADHKVFRLLRMIGFPLARIGEESFYMGSKTVPSILSVGIFMKRQEIEAIKV